MKWIIGFILVGIAVATVARALEQKDTGGTPVLREQGVRFGVVDVVVDSGNSPLAVWQVEVKATKGDVKFVGIEGGVKGFQDPPYYDPAAMEGGRIVIGAFSLGEELPQGKVRVARLHVRIGAGDQPVYAAAVMAAAGKDGKAVAATVTVEERGR